MMNPTTLILFALMSGMAIPAMAQTVLVPSGWTETTAASTRVITKGTSRIEIGPWVDIGSQSLDAWLATFANRAPDGAQLISPGQIKPERVPGAFAVTRKVMFSSGAGSSILYACPGNTGSARLMQLDTESKNFGDLFAGALFGEKVCQQERHDGTVVDQSVPQPEPPLTALPQSNQTLATANADIPKNNRPVSANVRLTQSWSGFPAILTSKATLSLTFPNGYAATCSDWDPVTLQPTPQSVGRKIKGCDVTRGSGEGKAARGFAPGETVNLKFGNVSAYSNDWAFSGGGSLSGGDLVMTKEGNIAVGRFQVTQIASGGNGVSSAKRNSLRGRYYLDGHTITIKTQSGEILHGFIGASSNTGSRKIDHIFLNGTHYWDRKKK